jgi:hypothetical protein
MAKPSFLPSTPTTVQRLFAEMPKSFSQDPLSKPILNLTIVSYPSTWSSVSYVTFTIADGTLSVASSESYILSELLLLKNYSINDLIDHFNNKYQPYGIQAFLYSEALYYEGEFSATTLIEGIYDITQNSTTVIDRFTSNNYSLLMAIALGLIDNEKNMKAALAQTDLRLAQEKWIDYWGRQLGITRQGNELYSDETYKNRIQAQITQQKSNNVALEYFVTSATGRSASVVDGGRPILLAGSAVIGGVNTAITGTSLPTVDGSGFTVNTTINGSNGIATATIATGGMGYKGGGSGTLTFTITGGTSLATGSVSVLNGVATGTITITSAGNGYAAGSNVATTATGSTGLTTYDESYRAGPTTGAGSFVVYVGLYDTEYVLPQPVYSSLITLINKWKPAGIPFMIKSTGGASLLATSSSSITTITPTVGFTWLPWYNPAILNQVTWE